MGKSSELYRTSYENGRQQIAKKSIKEEIRGIINGDATKWGKEL